MKKDGRQRWNNEQLLLKNLGFEYQLACGPTTPACSPALPVCDEGEVAPPQEPFRAEVLDQSCESRFQTLVRIRILRCKLANGRNTRT